MLPLQPDHCQCCALVLLIHYHHCLLSPSLQDLLPLAQRWLALHRPQRYARLAANKDWRHNLRQLTVYATPGLHLVEVSISLLLLVHHASAWMCVLGTRTLPYLMLQLAVLDSSTSHACAVVITTLHITTLQTACGGVDGILLHLYTHTVPF